jgi:Gpi18-like mannosyltransferase
MRHPPVVRNPRVEWTLILVSGLILAGLLRFSLREFESGDYRSFVGPWYEFIVENGGFLALKYKFSNYAPLYWYMLTAASYLWAGLPHLVAVKLISISFDFVCAAFVYRLVRLQYPHGLTPLGAFFAVLFAPTVVLNSSFWGQVDVVYTTGVVASVYFLAARREAAAFVAFGLALAFKQQAVFLAPVLLILLLRRSVSWKSFLLIPAMYAACLLPAWALGHPLDDLLTIPFQQADYYHDLTKNAPNLYQWLPNKLYDMLYPAGIVWAAAVVGLFILGAYRSRAPLTSGRVVQLATFSVVLLPFVLPKMHERYFFPADVLSIVFAFYFPQYFYVPVLVGLMSFLSYTPFLFQTEIIPLPWLAFAPLLTLVILFQHWLDMLRVASESPGEV